MSPRNRPRCRPFRAHASEKRTTQGIPGYCLREAIMLPHMKRNTAPLASSTELFDAPRVVSKQLS
jgi:hypothetical protein